MKQRANIRQPRREELTSVNEDGSRYAIHPADVDGRFTQARRISAILLIAIYAALPWIQINGYPAVYLDTDAMRFHFFGITFVSQDLWLAFFLISGLGFGLFYVTALFGRIWCGWACPQTVFLEHVYRRIERWIEGEAVARRRLDNADWNVSKIWKRLLKHGLFLLISISVAHLFMAYFLSLPQLWNIMRESPLENWGTFVFVSVFSGILYFNFAWFREQLCIVICPYGRLQSVLIDDHSTVIGYDEKRGEPRGKPTQDGVGDCIDCHRCVQVCPTGIDIRQGLQMECIGCAACIDACDTIMDKLDRPRGLVRYDSQEGLAGRATRLIRPRIILYSFLLVVGASVLIFSLQGLTHASLTAWRVEGSPYYLDQDHIRNQFIVRVTNKLNHSADYGIALDGLPVDAVATGVDGAFTLPENGEAVKTLVIRVPRNRFEGNFVMKANVVDSEGGLLAYRELEFIGPQPETSNQ